MALRVEPCRAHSRKRSLVPLAGRPPAVRGGGGEEGAQGCRWRRGGAAAFLSAPREKDWARGGLSRGRSELGPDPAGAAAVPAAALPASGALPSARAAQPERPPPASRASRRRGSGPTRKAPLGQRPGFPSRFPGRGWQQTAVSELARTRGIRLFN